MLIRPSAGADLAAVARVLLEARAAAGTAFPPAVHADAEMEPHLRRDVLPHHEVLVAEVDGSVAGVLVLEHDRSRDGAPADRPGPDLVDLLATAPAVQRHGVGSALLAAAKARAPLGLGLWVFASNAPARALSERRGFAVVGGTVGDDEEGAPDLLMRWDPSGSA